MRDAVFFHPDYEPPRRTGNSVTVGSGIGPDLLTFRCNRKRSRAQVIGSKLQPLPPVGNSTPP